MVVASSRMLCLIVAGAARGQGPPITAELVHDNLDRPIYVTHAPGDAQRLFVIEQPGRIMIIRAGTVLGSPFLDVSDLIEFQIGEQGLLGLAFHPEYETNGLFYIKYTEPPDSDSVLIRYEVSDDPDLADPDSAQIVLRIPGGQTQRHNAGWIDFGPDGNLYVATGDGGGPFDPQDDAQNLDSLLGKMLRIDVDCDQFPLDPDRNYGIPPDNPLVGVPGADEVWAWGLRNPWRCSFDRDTGDLYIGDVGQNSWEEIDFQPAGSPGGENYGWDCKEALECTGEPTCACSDTTLVDPMVQYAHPVEGSAAIVGGYVYRGPAIPRLVGHYLLADHSASRFWRLRHDGGRVTELVEITDELNPPVTTPSSFGEDIFGEIYLCARTPGAIYKIVSACPWDLDGAGVGITDLLLLLSVWGTDPGGPPDFDGDGDVGITDFLELLANWGPCP